MSLLLETYPRNVNIRPLFTKILDVDFYDGPTEALCQLVDSNEWFICSMVYFKPGDRDRIFTVIQVNDEYFSDLKSLLDFQSDSSNFFYEKAKEKISSIYKMYEGDVALFRAGSLIDSKYEIAQIPLEYLRHFGSVEDVLTQPEASMLQWRSFFRLND